MRPLVWYKSDLRIADHPALHHAARAAERGLVAVFVFCPRQWREEHDWGEAKVDFLRRNLADLSPRLAKLKIPLVFAETPDFSGVPGALLEVARQHDCNALYFNRELEVYEQRRERAVTKRFADAGLEVHAFHDQTVIAPEEIQTRTGDPYSVFTPFHRTWCKLVEERGGPELLAAPEPLPELVCPPGDGPEEIAGFGSVNGMAELWPAGEERARRDLESFLEEKAPDYPEHRDDPAREATSRLSAALALGVVSARTCLAVALAKNGGELQGGDPGLAAWMRQIAWREFYRHVLVGFPRVSRNRAFQESTEAIEWRRDDDDFTAWKDGRTGVPIVDAGMRQLRETGFMHNRLRMITAMFLTKDLFLEWRRGERHFMRHLVDGDLANNNGGWQWSASTGTDAAPYFRIFNPWTQGKRFDAEGRFIRHFVPELEKVPTAALHDAAKLARLIAERRLDYPEPIVDHRKARRRAIEAFKRMKK